MGDQPVYHHQQITAAPTPEQVARRSYTVTHDEQPHWSPRRGMDYAVRYFGAGNWCQGEDTPTHRFTTEAAAHAAGEQWNLTGRSAA